MPANLTYRVRHTRRLDAPVRTLSVATGAIVVTPPNGETFTVSAGDPDYTFESPTAGLDTYAPNGASVHVTFGDDAPEVEQERNLPGKGPKSEKKAPKRRTSTSRRKAAAKASSSKKSASKGSSRAKTSKAKSTSKSKRKRG